MVISQEDLDAIASAVWDEILADHILPGSTGKILNDLDLDFIGLLGDTARLLSLGGDRVSWEDLSDDGGNPPKFLQGTIVHFEDDDLTTESGIRYLITQTYGPNGETATLTQTRQNLNIFSTEFSEEFV